MGTERVVTRPHACILYAPGMPQWFYSRQPLTHDWIHFTDDPAVVPPGLECGRLYYPGSAGFLTELTRDIEFEFLSELPDGRRLMADKLDELPEEYKFTPFIGFVFVDEPYRGKRLSELMIQSAILYARELGYEKIYIMSGEIGLYEKYGFEKLGDYETIYGSIDQLFVKSTIL